MNKKCIREEEKILHRKPGKEETKERMTERIRENWRRKKNEKKEKTQRKMAWKEGCAKNKEEWKNKDRKGK